MAPDLHKGAMMHRTTFISIAVAAIALGVLTQGAFAGTISLTAIDREPAEGREVIEDARLEELAAAVEAEPKDRQARFELVQALMQSRKLDKALAAAKAWREKDAYNLVVVRLLGDIYAELGETEQALRTYSAVVELLPKDASAQRALASVLKQSGNMKAAYERLTAAASLRPEDMRLKFELADAAHRVGELIEARDLFEAIASSDSAPSAISYPAKQRLAQIYNEQRRAASKSGDSARAAELQQAIGELDIKGGTVNDIKVYLTWDTDRSDVDLWVTNPVGEKVYYSHRKGKFGGALYDDVTTGYGPESFTARKAAKGVYTVEVNYFSAGRSNFPEARGEVVVVLNEGSDDEVKHVLPYRLFRAKQTVTVARIEVQ